MTENTLETNKSQDRQELIETAVRFLQNPKVMPTPVESKRLFLSKKGLTESEINAAITKANLNQNPQELVSVPTQNKPEPNKIGFWMKILKLVKNLIIAGCLTFAAYKLIIKKYLLKNRSKSIELNNKKDEINTSLKEIKSSLNGLKETMDKMIDSVKEISREKSKSPSQDSDGQNGQNLKSELQIIKNLLLSRTQFPSIPTVSPVLPTWQLESKNSNNTSPKEKLTNSDGDESSPIKKDENTSENNSCDENSQ